jgi:hypothetical protein
MLSVIMLSVIVLSVVMLSVVMLSVIMLSVVMLSVIAPFAHVLSVILSECVSFLLINLLRMSQSINHIIFIS